MPTLIIPDIETGTSILHVTDESGKAVLEIRKLPKRVVIVAEVDGDALYKIREDSNDAHVAIVDMKLKKVVEKFRNKLRLSGKQASENFACVPTSIKENGILVAERNPGQQLQIHDYENHALLVAVYIAAKKLVFISPLDPGDSPTGAIISSIY